MTKYFLIVSLRKDLDYTKEKKKKRKSNNIFFKLQLLIDLS